MKIKESLLLIKDLYYRFFEDDILSISAQATYFLLLSVSPFLIFFITLLSFLPFVNLNESIELLHSILPSNAYSIILNIVNDIIANRNGTILSFGMITTLWSSSLGVSALIKGINRAYDQQETRPFWKVIIVSIYFNIELSFVIIFSLVFIIFGKYLGDKFDLSISAWNNTRYTIAFLMINVIFISFYHNTPNRRIKFRDVLPGSITASFLWVFISVIFAYYANNLGNFSKVYGSLGGIFALLTWIYISSIIILIGAEINASLFFSKQGHKKIKLLKF